MPNFGRYELVAKEVIGKIIHELTRDEETDFGIITVTGVKISTDQSYLDVYVSAFRNAEMLPKSLAKHGFEIQRRANKEIAVRRVPKIRFRYDEGGEKQADMTKFIDSL